MATREVSPFFSVYKFLAYCVLGAVSIFLPCGKGWAQSPVNTKVPIQILHANELTVSRSPEGTEVNKLIGDVQLQQAESYMNCDSAYINLATNNVEAFGSVQITQPGGTRVESDYLRYTGNTRVAYLQGNVSLTDGANHLWSEELTYDLGTKIGTYTNGGTLQSETTTLSSNSGMYNARTKDSRFTGEVNVSDPKYTAVSDDLGYNTESKVVTFYGPSIVNNDKSELRTSSGTWDAKQEIARFNSRSSIRNVEQYIEADTIRYNRNTGFGVAKGNVMALDTVQQTTLYSGYASYNELTRVLYAAIKPVLKHLTSNDSIFIRADTFYSAHLEKPVVDSLPLTVDSLQLTNGSLQLAKDNVLMEADSVQLAVKDRVQAVKDTAQLATVESLPVPVDKELQITDTVQQSSDTILAKEKRLSRKERKRSKAQVKVAAKQPKSKVPKPATDIRPTASEIPDTSMPRFYTGFHHVTVFSDSLQARCDSIIYSGRDSTMRLIYDPVAWSKRSQITGDTILLILDSNKLDRLFVPDKAFVVSRSGPERAGLYDQIQGKTLTGYFTDNEIDRMVVFPNAEAIYYAKDETDAYLGVNQATSERMRIFFQEQEISRILFEQEPKQTMTPMQDVNIPSMRLSRFRWREDERPKTRESLFE